MFPFESGDPETRFLRENGIVPNYYGNTRDIFLLTIINTNTGEESEIGNIGRYSCFETARYLGNTMNSIVDKEGEEGVVLKYENNFRVKIKFEEYKKITNILSGMTYKKIFAAVAGTPEDYAEFLKLVAILPTNIKRLITSYENKLRSDHKNIENICNIEFKEAETNLCVEARGSRKEIATTFSSCSYPTVLFQMLDEKDYHKSIWKVIKKDISPGIIVGEAY